MHTIHMVIGMEIIGTVTVGDTIIGGITLTITGTVTTGDTITTTIGMVTTGVGATTTGVDLITTDTTGEMDGVRTITTAGEILTIAILITLLTAMEVFGKVNHHPLGTAQETHM